MANIGMLSKIVINTPCSEDWAKMTGDKQRRHCHSCKKNVYNLEEMSETEALALVSSGKRVCVRLYRRPDGTVLTKECGRGMRKRWTANAVFTSVMFALLGTFGLRPAFADEKGHTKGIVALPTPVQTHIMGDFSPPPELLPDEQHKMGEAVMIPELTPHATAERYAPSPQEIEQEVLLEKLLQDTKSQ